MKHSQHFSTRTGCITSVSRWRSAAICHLLPVHIRLIYGHLHTFVLQLYEETFQHKSATHQHFLTWICSYSTNSFLTSSKKRWCVFCVFLFRFIDLVLRIFLNPCHDNLLPVRLDYIQLYKKPNIIINNDVRLFIIPFIS